MYYIVTFPGMDGGARKAHHPRKDLPNDAPPDTGKYQCELISQIIEYSDREQYADTVGPLRCLLGTITDDNTSLELGFNSEEWALFCALVIAGHDAILIDLTMSVLLKLFTVFPSYNFTFLFDPIFVETMHWELDKLTETNAKAVVIRALAKMASLSSDVARVCQKFSACVRREMTSTCDDDILFYGLRYFLALLVVDPNPGSEVWELVRGLAESTKDVKVRVLAFECILSIRNGPEEMISSLAIEPEKDEVEIVVVKLKLLRACAKTGDVVRFFELVWSLVSERVKKAVLTQTLVCLKEMCLGPSGERMEVPAPGFRKLVKLLGSHGFDVDLLIAELIVVLCGRVSDGRLLEADLELFVPRMCSILSSQSCGELFEGNLVDVLARISRALKASGDDKRLAAVFPDDLLEVIDGSQRHRLLDILEEVSGEQ